jgi:hypothetical protein
VKKAASGPKTDLAGCLDHVRLPQDAELCRLPIKVGISGQDTIVGFSQGWKLSGAIKTAEQKLTARTLLHAAKR